MARHPSGKGAQVHEKYVVRENDSLWTIAEDLLGADDVRAVARYWPRIHQANRATIGPDPSLIRPGQVLELPPFDLAERN
jgi:nucleoid-associated protein YgaU